ncbi:MAG: glycoside hydrolase family 2 [Verrucomicrobia bacterium]|nr:MAG: glycoside hydrolase family 2 [Verrucomicrobiota bacterium]
MASRTCILSVCFLLGVGRADIPLPEHPRPDFQRPDWVNLNGSWQFRFDAADAGEREQWFAGETEFPLRITVPFPWGSALSGVGNQTDVGWYRRSIRVPGSWEGRRVYLVIGASDWHTTAWLDGHLLGKHRGGYTPFEFDLTEWVRPGEEQILVVRVDDRPHPFKLEGKQGYGPAKGIWQTVYLEARPETHLEYLHFLPDIDAGKVTVRGSVSRPPRQGTRLELRFLTGGLEPAVRPLDPNSREFTFEVPIPHARLWSLEDPFLYEVEAALEGPGGGDRVRTYFGMRKISAVKLPGLGHPYIALNNRPIYIESTLDQAYHPEGFYTWPSDAFMRDEILRTRRLGLNMQRIHVKIDLPRKLYWADRLGVLLMCDVPNSWGEPDAEMRFEVETALRGMIRRDFNHPAIFCWVPFNETWGLFTRRDGRRAYLPETQEWVASIYDLAKRLDPTRLVEDNSPCNYDHVATDINSWHAYLPGYEWKSRLDQICRDTFPGSEWNFIGGRKQAGQPLLNSECGNVWGYEGSTGDCDWSWDYHIMINEFRRHPEVCGWLYTEHHDVINEWNGYYRYDRSEKDPGFAELVEGMSLRDLHAPFYISTGSDLCRDVAPGGEVEVPLYASFTTDRAPADRLRLRVYTYGWDSLGRGVWVGESTRWVRFEPWLHRELEPLRLTMPEEPALIIAALMLETPSGSVLHRNFTTFRVTTGEPLPRDEVKVIDGARCRVLRFAPDSFIKAAWSLKQWNVLGGLKVNGAGHGFFEYEVRWPEGLVADGVGGATLVFEAGAKQLFGKDRENAGRLEGDYMRGQGAHDPGLNPNAYPMTDTVKFPSAVRVRINGRAAEVIDLPDDPADHRGILSWHAQLRDRRLREAGSYGYLWHVTVPPEAVEEAARSGRFVVRFEVDPSLPGGLALYGERFGRYPIDPALVLELKP